MEMAVIVLIGAVVLNYQALADRITRAIAPEKGERVLLVCQPGRFDEIVAPLRTALVAAGAVDLGCETVAAAPAAGPAKDDPAIEGFKTKLRNVDAAVMLPGASPAHAPYAALQELLVGAGGPRRTIHFHWDGGGAPSAVRVEKHPLPPQQVIDETYQRAILETDYDALASVEAEFESAMRKEEVRVTTPSGTNLRFRIGERPVNRQDGNASAARSRKGVILIDREIELPAGAVRVAPLEESVEGTIAFPNADWGGAPVRGLKVRFIKGRAVSIEAVAGGEAVEAEMAKAGDSGRAFREFALGFNPFLEIPSDAPWIPYYGYGAGVVRLSVGDNSELGGAVTGGYVRWNFFPDATVIVGETVWVRDGKMMRPSVAAPALKMRGAIR